MTATDTHRAIRAVFKIESAKLIASLTRVTRDIGLAEELAQDALVAALERWPQTGIPEKPAAWLMATAKHRAIDNLRRKKLAEQKHAEIGRELEADQAMTPDIDAALDDDIGDDLLRLIFTACHPVLPAEARVALTLRLLGGLTTEEIARSFLQSEPTIAQRIVRAKKSLTQARVPFEVPRGHRSRRPPRLGTGGDLSRFQRRLFRNRRRRLDAACLLRRSLAARADSGGACAERAGSARPCGADGNPGLALRARAPGRMASRFCCSTRTARAGISC